MKASRLDSFGTPVLIALCLILLVLLLGLSWLTLVCLNTLGFLFPISSDTILSVAGLILIIRFIIKL